MYLTIVDHETGSCHLLIMLGRGASCWVTIFSQRIHLMLLHEMFQTPVSNNNKEKYTSWWHTQNTHFTQTGIVEYVIVLFR